MSGHRHGPGASAGLSPVRMGVAERLGLAALGCALVWAGVFWAIG
jgi:hypothetical protein